VTLRFVKKSHNTTRKHLLSKPIRVDLLGILSTLIVDSFNQGVSVNDAREFVAIGIGDRRRKVRANYSVFGTFIRSSCLDPDGVRDKDPGAGLNGLGKPLAVKGRGPKS